MKRILFAALAVAGFTVADLSARCGSCAQAEVTEAPHRICTVKREVGDLATKQVIISHHCPTDSEDEGARQ